jgi:hypothetical protein
MVPQAGIVNFYPAGQVMGGHVDDGEEAHECPVVSFSLGPPCIFLLGGVTKDVAPVPLLLRSGDVLVLGGESRLKYHGIPKVFVDHGPPQELVDFTPTPAPAPAPTNVLPGVVDVNAHENEVNLHQCGCPRFLSLFKPNTSRNAVYRPPTGGQSPIVEAEAGGASRTCTCTCDGISNEEISRALKVLRCARINVNLRQVYKTESSGGGGSGIDTKEVAEPRIRAHLIKPP